MNLILLTSKNYNSVTGRAKIFDRQFEHVKKVLASEPGQSLRVGLVGGLMGKGHIVDEGLGWLELEVTLYENPPEPMPVTLILALPRPKSIGRILQSVSSLGVKQIYLINCFKVEKPYWSVQQLRQEQIRKALELGLEQAKDTTIPEVHLRPLFKPFVEDDLPGIIEGTTAFVAHPGAGEPVSTLRDLVGPATICIGPEGGFIDYEVEKLKQAGLKQIHLGPRILKVESAITTTLAQLL